MSFTQQLQQCTRGGKTRPLSKLLSPLQSEPQSPIYASPPLSPVNDAPNVFGKFISSKDPLFPLESSLATLEADIILRFWFSDSFLGAMNIYQPVLRHNNFAKAPDTHFARDTHMRIILGNTSGSPFTKDKKHDSVQESTNLKSR